ncbi:MAG: membrane protein insertase YidC [Gammaproteobacteria bacterium]|jgi:YidC/Oxa1 family membrane protein insertase|nr:membrane protein insertase YidC [Gammaproteobacteria bacterium]
MDNSRLFLFAALVFVGMLMWQQWQADYGPQPVPSGTQETTGISPQQPPDIISADLPDPANIVEGSAAAPADGDQTIQPASVQQLITVDTDVVRALIDTRGGVLRSVKLKKYPTSLEQPDDWLELVHSESDSAHILQSGLRNKEDKAPTHHSMYAADQTDYRLADGEDELIVPLRWVQDGIEVTKTYRFRRGDYLIDVAHRVNNRSDQDWQGSQYRQIQRTRPLETSRLLYTYTGSVYYNEETKYEKVDFDDMEDSQVKLDSTGGWIAMIQHYFLSAWIPDQENKNLIYTIANTRRSPATYTIGLRSQNLLVPAGANGEFSSQLFVGPKIVNRLEEISPGLDLTVDYGVLTFLSKPLYWLLSWYHGFVGNWGVAIILLTLTVKAVFYKLSETSYRSMAKMRKVSPRLKTLKERYGDDRQKMNQAMMELYKTEKINPMGGCLPILVQIPVFIALYWALLESVDLRQAPFIFWIKDLSVMDPFYVLPIVMGISMVIQQRLNPPPPDPIQAKIMMALPFVFTIFFAFFPSGLVLYWVINNVLSIAQQWVITKRIEAAGK